MTRKDILYQHLIAFQGIDGKINDIPCRFLVTEEEDYKENKYDLKNIVTDQPIRQGDYVTIDGALFMIVDTKKVINSIYTLGTFRGVSKITLQSNLKDIYAVIDKVRGLYTQGQEITEVHDEYTFIIPKSSTNMTSATPNKNAIIYEGGSYDAVSIDDSKEGVLIITGRLSNLYNPHVYTISLSETTKTLVETETYSIIATATDNETIVSNPQLTFKSSDTIVATVDSNTGVVSAVKAGSATITVTYQNVSATVYLTVNAKPVTPVISYTENWSQTTTIKQYVTSTYVATRTTDGIVETPLIDYVFDSTGQALISTSKIVVTRKADNSFSVKNGTITTTTTCYVNITDHSSGHVIANQLLTFTKGI